MAAHQALDSAIQALRNGERDTALTLLHQLTEAEPLWSDGWLWLAAASDTSEVKLAHLRQAHALNPHDARVVAGLRALGENVSDPAVAVPIPGSTATNVASSTSVAESKPEKSAAAKTTWSVSPNPLVMPRFVATDVRAARPIPWPMIALMCLVLLLIPLTFWLI